MAEGAGWDFESKRREQEARAWDEAGSEQGPMARIYAAVGGKEKLDALAEFANAQGMTAETILNNYDARVKHMSESEFHDLPMEHIDTASKLRIALGRS